MKRTSLALLVGSLLAVAISPAQAGHPGSSGGSFRGGTFGSPSSMSSMNSLPRSNPLSNSFSNSSSSTLNKSTWGGSNSPFRSLPAPNNSGGNTIVNKSSGYPTTLPANSPWNGGGTTAKKPILSGNPSILGNINTTTHSGTPIINKLPLSGNQPIVNKPPMVIDPGFGNGKGPKLGQGLGNSLSNGSKTTVNKFFTPGLGKSLNGLKSVPASVVANHKLWSTKHDAAFKSFCVSFGNAPCKSAWDWYCWYGYYGCWSYCYPQHNYLYYDCLWDPWWDGETCVPYAGCPAQSSTYVACSDSSVVPAVAETAAATDGSVATSSDVTPTSATETTPAAPQVAADGAAGDSPFDKVASTTATRETSLAAAAPSNYDLNIEYLTAR